VARTRKRLLGAVALAAAVTVGCSADPAGGGAAPASSAAVADAAAVWHEFVSCARENGQATWPDAVVDEIGRAAFPVAEGFSEKEAYQAVRESCGAILDRLPAQANPLAAPSFSPEQMEVLQRYVQCLRDNGMPDMPDPGPNGEIVDPPRYADPPLRDTRNAARNACDRILTEDFQ
jgi:hypothetical protein